MEFDINVKNIKCCPVISVETFSLTNGEGEDYTIIVINCKCTKADYEFEVWGHLYKQEEVEEEIKDYLDIE